MKKDVIKEWVLDINKIIDDPLIQFIKEYFEKKDNIQLIGIDTQGDQVVLALCANDTSEEENQQYKREEAKQSVYDIKYNLEKEIQDKYGFTPLSIRGLNVVDGLIQFEINFIYKNQPGKRIFSEREESKKELSFKEEVENDLITLLEKQTGKKVILKKKSTQEGLTLEKHKNRFLEAYSVAQQKLASKVLKDPDVEFLLNLMNKVFLKSRTANNDFVRFEKLHKNTFSKLVQIRNNVTTELPLQYPLGNAAAYQTVYTELKAIAENEEPVVVENNSKNNVIEFRNYLEETKKRFLKEAAVDHFWIVTRKISKDDELSDILIDTDFAELELMFKGGLEASDILGAYTNYNEAERVAKKVLINQTILNEIDVEDPEFEGSYLDYEEMRRQQELKDLNAELEDEEEN